MLVRWQRRGVGIVGMEFVWRLVCCFSPFFLIGLKFVGEDGERNLNSDILMGKADLSFSCRNATESNSILRDGCGCLGGCLPELWF